MKLRRAAFCLAFYAGAPLMAQTPPAGGPGAPPAANAAYDWDFAPLVQELDTNHDGLISLQEWKAAGICESIFHLLHSAPSGDLTVAELSARHPQPEADTDHTHKLTVKKMIWVCNAGPKGPPPKS